MSVMTFAIDNDEVGVLEPYLFPCQISRFFVHPFQLRQDSPERVQYIVCHVTNLKNNFNLKPESDLS